MPAAGQSDQTYYEEDFSNKSFGEEIYEEDFDFGKAGWSYTNNNAYRSNTQAHSWRHEGSEIVLSMEITGFGDWGATQEVQRDISFPSDGEYYFLVTSHATMGSNSYGASIDEHELVLSGDNRGIDDGTTLVTKDMNSGSNDIRVRSWSNQPGSGPDDPVEMELRVDELQIIKQEHDPQRTWEAQNFIVYVDDGISGNSIHGRDFYGNVNVSPAHKADGPVILEFDIKTSGSSASWSASQLGTTLGSGTITANTNRKVRQEVDLQSGDLRLDFSSSEQVTVDNIKVSGAGTGNASTGGSGLPDPSVGLLASASGDAGRNWATGITNNLFDFAFTLLQWGSIIAVCIGGLLMGISTQKMRNTRGHALFVGGVIGIILVFGLPMGLQTVGWISTGDTDTASLENPGMDPTAVKFSEEFEEATFEQTGWEISGGSSGDVFIEGSEGNRHLEVQGSGATISKEIKIERGESIPAANLKLDARINSKVGMQPPDTDGVNVTVLSDGDRVVDEKTVATASGGDINEKTGTASFNLTSSEITVRITATDLNGDDGTVDIQIDDIKIQSLIKE
jgi:hypothetical protein